MGEGPDDASTAPASSDSTHEQRGLRVVIAFSPDPERIGVARVLGRRALEIGREADWSLADPSLSRRHASLGLDEQGSGWVRDLDSRNGVFVDGARVREALLRDGSVLRVGDQVLVAQELDGRDVARLLQPGPRTSSRLLGESVRLRALRARIAEVAESSAPVLLQGESGTGKELAAAEIHARSGRRGRFVPVNCGAIPEHLAESELFGHQRGAFTGAAGATDGLFGAAHGGTIFLDEIGEASAATQARLLRVLESGEVRRVGDAEARQVDVRIVAATHIDLAEAVEHGRFRGDLLARLRAHVVGLPPLRERKEDVLPLFFAQRADAGALPSTAEIVGGLTPDAAEVLLLHAWPWNVRELVQLARSVAGIGRVDLTALPAEMRGGLRERAVPTPAAPLPATAVLEVRPWAVPTADELRSVLAHFGGNVAKTAEFFGKERRQVYRWAERFEIDLSTTRDED